jgi:hypothetical protein
MAYAELWSFLVERIGHDPEWLQLALGVPEREALQVSADLTLVDLMMFFRLNAKFAYELDLFEGDPLDRDRGRGIYSQVLSSRTGFGYDPRGWQFDRDEGFYSADYLRAFMASAALVQRLEAQFGRPWWRHSSAGQWLRERWRLGWEPEAEETVEESGGPPWSGEPLLEVFKGKLAAGAGRA